MFTKEEIDGIILAIARRLEYEKDLDKRLELLNDFKNKYCATLLAWYHYLKSYAEEKALKNVLSVLDIYYGPKIKSTNSSESIDDKTNVEDKDIGEMPVYKPPSEEEKKKVIDELRVRAMRYSLMMSMVDGMYHKGKIKLRDYYVLRDSIGKHYSFDRKSLFFWDGPYER
ncbi:MAG: hypothetical protein J6J39_07300 [Clostridia bacterium]|nr:hypothetical protein [Clostridia bacterium]